MAWVGLEHVDARCWYLGKRSDHVQGISGFQICSSPASPPCGQSDSLKPGMSS